MTTIVSTFFACVGLSADAFAASVARGTAMPRRDLKAAFRHGATFGGTEGTMCLLGFLLAASFGGIVAAVDHWFALGLLSLIGGKMVLEGVRGDGDDAPAETVRSGKQAWFRTLVTAVGTSIDSAAAGAALALSGASIILPFAVGFTSFGASVIGFLLGPTAGARLGRSAEVIGGAILIFIGVRIFWEHTVGA